ncbi:MAG TPA: hypothetical protein VHM26_11275 [Chitinophagaceae bacterium]|nr:hypothetical protein [Chitinophagaceae bacterium]
MIKQLFVVSILVFLTSRIFAQNISSNDFNNLIRNYRPLYFDNANKKYFGCGMNLDCMGLEVAFKSVALQRAQKKLELSGYINPVTVGDGDTIGTNIFKIFIARPGKRKLKHIRVLADFENTIKNKSEGTTIDLNKKSFITKFKFSRKDCLYIESTSLFRLKEYDIGSLLRYKD